jgi:hypothetical protein
LSCQDFACEREADESAGRAAPYKLSAVEVGGSGGQPPSAGRQLCCELSRRGLRSVDAAVSASNAEHGRARPIEEM